MIRFKEEIIHELVRSKSAAKALNTVYVEKMRKMEAHAQALKKQLSCKNKYTLLSECM